MTLIPDAVPDPIRFLVLANAAVLLTGVAKSGFGSGLGLLAVPLMVGACWVPATQQPDNNVGLALALLLPILIACDYVALFNWWGRWDWGILRRLLPGTLVGVLAAWAAFHQLQHIKGGLMIMVAAISIVMPLLHLLRRAPAADQPIRPTLLHASVFGSAAGYTSMLSHAAGPIIALFLLPQHLNKQVFVATSAMYFFLLNQVKLAPMYQLGQLRSVNWWTELLFLPMVLGGSMLGKYLDTKVPQALFTKVVYGSVVLSGGVLVWLAWGVH